jgi:hypothetical protein
LEKKVGLQVKNRKKKQEIKVNGQRQSETATNELEETIAVTGCVYYFRKEQNFTNAIGGEVTNA